MRRQLESDLAAAADPQRAKNAKWFFKTGKGQYGERDRFLGVSVPVQRRIALRYRTLPLNEIATLLESSWHEHRFTALEILAAQYDRGTDAARGEIFEFYLAHIGGINNWDLVDTSAPYIIGEHLRSRSRRLLVKMVES